MFDEIKRNFGFGCMRLPMKGDKVDEKEFCEMIDIYMQNGFNYFDTAHGYISGKSETAIRDCLSARYPREKFVLTNKLSDWSFKTQKDIRPLFESQLKLCGVTYFDFYLMHAQNKKNFEQYKRCNAYETALELKKEGKIKHLGMSFHDDAQTLDKILTQYPQVEIVQLQFNYLDYDDPAVQSKMCYDVCLKHGKPVIVMEPVKGGHLANLPDNAKKYFDELGDGKSYASYAVRYAASFENVALVISGMSNLAQMQDNLSSMKNFVPLSDKEKQAVAKVRAEFRKNNLIPCTACRYCTDGCPKKISIPDLFACMNTKSAYKDWNADYYYGLYTGNGGKASDCIECGKCENACPQHLEIRKLLKNTAKEFEMLRT